MLFSALRFVYLLALAIWLGTMVFHSFVVAPTLFAALPQHAAGDAVSRLFPKYYLLGYACGAACTLIPLVLWLSGRSPSAWGPIALLGASMWAATVFAGTVVHGKASALRQELRTGNEAVRPAFVRWHRVAVVLNLAVLATGVGVTVLVARQLD